MAGRRGRQSDGTESGPGRGPHRIRTICDPEPILHPPSDFHCDVEPAREAVVVRPVGELDLATGPVLERRMCELRDAGFRRLVLDLGGLSFMDSTGIALVVRWDLDARADGFDFALLPGTPGVQRLFELTGLTGRLQFRPR